MSTSHHQVSKERQGGGSEKLVSTALNNLYFTPLQQRCSRRSSGKLMGSFWHGVLGAGETE